MRRKFTHQGREGREGGNAHRLRKIARHEWARKASTEIPRTNIHPPAVVGLWRGKPEKSQSSNSKPGKGIFKPRMSLNTRKGSAPKQKK
jgi:hypothetical protein